MYKPIIAKIKKKLNNKIKNIENIRQKTIATSYPNILKKYLKENNIEAKVIEISGSVEISRSVEGRKFVIERLQPGELFGEIEFIGGMNRTVTARAVGETTIGLIDREAVQDEYGRVRIY